MLTDEQVTIVKAWIHDLRTTDAPQVQESLWKRGSSGIVGFCCLGRLCVVTGESMPAESSDENKSRYAVPHPDNQPIANRILNELDGIAKYWQLNDNENKSFKEIADVVEADLNAILENKENQNASE